MNHPYVGEGLFEPELELLRLGVLVFLSMLFFVQLEKGDCISAADEAGDQVQVSPVDVGRERSSSKTRK